MSVSIFLSSAVFIATVISSIIIFYKATGSRLFTLIISLWCIMQSVIAANGFYENEMSTPPRMAFLVLPLFLTIALFFVFKKGRMFIDKVNIKYLLLLHVVRIPVELVLNASFQEGMIPAIMTFHGNNFDILSGISALLMYYLCYVKNSLGRKSLIAWNFVCLALLLNIMFIGIFSVETPFQKFGFEQPNEVMLHFPLVLLPGCVVPLVLFSHLIALRKLFREVAPVQHFEKAELKNL